MLEITSKDRCCGCHACYNACPKQCISMVSDSEGFVYPNIDRSKCIDCGLCEKVCPVIAPPGADDRESVAFAAVNKDENTRLQSSSGGIFSVLAEQILKENGVIFGAALSEDCRQVNHIVVESPADIPLLQGSKYVQSNIGDTYQNAENALKAGRTVLFSGTPCQIAGLYKYLNKPYEKLYTCDIICHGVPSPLVWQNYVKYREEQAASKVRRASFRHKKYGWKRFSLQLVFMNSAEYTQILGKDLFLHGFLSNIYLRPSCYNCKFKGLKRPADITLADFWGIENVAPHMYDNKGTSLVIVHSEKGSRLLGQLGSSISAEPVDIDKAIKYNSAAVKSVAIPKARVPFFKDFGTVPFAKLFKKYCSIGPKEKIRKCIGAILRKIKTFRRG